MASYVSLINFTEKGGANIKDTVNRAEAFLAKAKSMGLKVYEIYWTLGAYDGVLVFEAADDETATACLLAIESLGNVKSHTLRAFTLPEMKGILAKAFK